MDFGDILNQWEDSQKKKPQQKQNQVSHKKANAPTKEEKEAAKSKKTFEQIMYEDSQKTINPMELWLNRYGTVDKDKIAEDKEAKDKLHDLNYLKSLSPQAVIDLHQKTRDEAWEMLENFVNDCYRRRLNKILIIHGKGNHSSGSDSILGPMVRSFIECDKRLGISGHPDRNHGGNGATWVIIKY